MVQVNLRYNDRAVLAGRTGSGKTYFARYVCRPLNRLIVFDPKGTLNTPDWNLEDWNPSTLRRLQKGQPGRLRVPAPLDMDWEPYMQMAYELGSITVYIDEVYGVVEPGKKPGLWFTALYTRGRELGIGVWAATQRPSWVPLFTLSEADWFFIFRLNLEDDRRRVASMSTPQLLEPIKDRHGFWTYNPEWERALYTARFQGHAEQWPTKELANVS